MTLLISLEDLLQRTAQPLEGHPALPDYAIERQLTLFPDWSYLDGFIVREFRFENYYETLAYLNAIAWVVHRQDHHPEVTLTYNRCKVRFNTHSVGGISTNDFICAAHCDAIYAVGRSGSR